MDTIILISGYRRTGKDIVYRILTEQSEFKYQVYSSPTCRFKFSTVSRNYRRLAFADTLKSEVNDKFQIPLDEATKDIKQYQHPRTNQLISARDMYREWASYQREKDPDYWADQVLSQVEPGSSYLITDWRYPNELRKFHSHSLNLITARVYRRQVEVSPDYEEHQLDSTPTDLLLVASSADYDSALDLFPFYSLHSFSEEI